MANPNPYENRPGQTDENSQREAPRNEAGTPGVTSPLSGEDNERNRVDNVQSIKSGARGTAAMDPGTRQEVARKGGLAVSRNKSHMADIGRRGGQSVSRNREHMAEIGRKGGAASRGPRVATSNVQPESPSPSVNPAGNSKDESGSGHA